MLDLNNTEEWRKLENAFDDAVKIPDMIKKIIETPDREVLVELTTEYLSHQTSIYEATFAAFPHLVQICERLQEPDDRLNMFLDLGLLLKDFGGDAEMVTIFKNSKSSPEIVSDLMESFRISFKQLKPIAASLMEYVKGEDDETKQYFLISLAVAHEVFFMSSVLWRYNDNTEYDFFCPHCKKLVVLLNEPGQDVLFVQNDYPSSKGGEERFPAHPATIDRKDFSAEILPGNSYQWLSYYIDELSIDTLRVVVNYLFGDVDCPHCQKNFNIFERIIA